MTEKRTFPGAINAAQQELLAKQQEAEKLAAEKANARRIAERQKSEKQKAEVQKRKKLIETFAPSMSASSVVKALGTIIAVNYVVGGLDRVGNDYTVDSQGYEDFIGPNLGDAIHEAYDPYFHGAVGFYDAQSYRDSTVNDRWKRHMTIVGIEAFILACILIGRTAKRHSVTEDVDTMLLFKERVTQNKHISQSMIKKMVNVAPEIVDHMSKDSAIYFEMLMKGTFDCEQDSTVLAFAKAVLAGHLASHPADMERVLSVFDERTLPQSLVAQYKQNVK